MTVPCLDWSGYSNLFTVFWVDFFETNFLDKRKRLKPPFHMNSTIKWAKKAVVQNLKILQKSRFLKNIENGTANLDVIFGTYSYRSFDQHTHNSNILAVCRFSIGSPTAFWRSYPWTIMNNSFTPSNVTRIAEFWTPVFVNWQNVEVLTQRYKRYTHNVVFDSRKKLHFYTEATRILFLKTLKTRSFPIDSHWVKLQLNLK